MAAAERFERRARVPLRAILQKALMESLPGEVTSNTRFRRLAERDSLSPSRERHRQRREDPWRSVIEMLRRGERHERFPAAFAREMLEPIASEAMGPTLQSYYTAAIAIGRRWRYARNRLRWAKSGSESKMLKLTVRANEDLAGAANWLPPTEKERLALFGRLFIDAREIAQRESDLAQKDWATWERRMENLERGLAQISEDVQGLDALSAIILVPLRLQWLAEEAVAGLPSDVSKHAPRGIATWSQMLIPILLMQAANGEGGSDRNLAMHLEHIIDLMERQMARARDEAEYGDARRRQKARLEEKYGESNPFSAYAPLQRCADEELLTLRREHRLVGDGGVSQWLEEWHRRLVKSPGWSSKSLPFTTAKDHARIERSAAWADSEVKRELCSRFSPEPAGMESFNEFSRRLWIDEWVKWVVRNLKKEESRDSRWTREAVFDFVEAVRARLAKQGYDWEPLTKAEHQELWSE